MIPLESPTNVALKCTYPIHSVTIDVSLSESFILKSVLEVIILNYCYVKQKPNLKLPLSLSFQAASARPRTRASRTWPASRTLTRTESTTTWKCATSGTRFMYPFQQSWNKAKQKKNGGFKTTDRKNMFSETSEVVGRTNLSYLLDFLFERTVHQRVFREFLFFTRQLRIGWWMEADFRLSLGGAIFIIFIVHPELLIFCVIRREREKISTR